MRTSGYQNLKGEKIALFKQHHKGAIGKFLEEKSNLIGISVFHNGNEKRLPNKGLLAKKNETPYDYAERLIIAPCQINKKEWLGKMYYWLISEFRLQIYSAANDRFIDFFKINFSVKENRLTITHYLYSDFKKMLLAKNEAGERQYSDKEVEVYVTEIENELLALTSKITAHAHPQRDDAFADILGFTKQRLSNPKAHERTGEVQDFRTLVQGKAQAQETKPTEPQEWIAFKNLVKEQVLVLKDRPNFKKALDWFEEVQKLTYKTHDENGMIVFASSMANYENVENPEFLPILKTVIKYIFGENGKLEYSLKGGGK